MIILIDNRNGFIIQKVVKPNGKLVAYQTVPRGMVNGDASHVRVFPTLQAAREAVKEYPTLEVRPLGGEDAR